MPYLAKEHVDIPSKDLLSWTFDDIKYDWDEPRYLDAANPTASISARQAKSMIRKLIAGLRHAGLEKGDTLCLHSLNHLYYPILVLGTVAASGVWTGTNPGYTPLELSHHITVTKANFFIVEEELMEPMLAAIKVKGIQNSKIYLFDHEGDGRSKYAYPSWTTLLDHGEADWETFDDESIAKSTTAMLLTTSGTTGLPKAAEISHFNLVAQHTLVWERQDAARPWAYNTLIALPMFHAAMAPLCHTSVLRSGYVAYMQRKFDVNNYMEYVDKYRCTELLMVPPVVLRIVMSEEKGKYDLTCVKRGWCGAAPLDKELQRRFEDIVGGSMTQVWGMTEASCIVSMTPPPHSDPSGSVGTMLANMDLKFIDDDGNEVLTPGVRGEMCVRGPTIIRGYFENPEANARDFDSDNYYHSGDIGYLEPDTQRIFIVDRKKELIKVRGFQVAPNEIEGVLLTHSGIVDAAVVGLTVPSSPDAELVRAYVVLRNGHVLDEREVAQFSGGLLSGYKSLTGGVKFVDAIPKTASGKILKRLLREQAMKELKAEGAKL